MFAIRSLRVKPTALLLSCALATAASQGVMAATDPVQLTVDNPTLASDIEVSNPGQSGYTDVALQAKGATKFVIDDRSVTLSVTAAGRNATAMVMSGDSNPVSLSAQNAKISATAESGNAIALQIKATTEATVTGGSFSAVGTGKFSATALDLSNVRNTDTTVTLDGVTLSASAQQRADSIYSGHSENGAYKSTIYLKNSVVAKGDIFFESSTYADGTADHAYALKVENSQIGTSSNYIAIHSQAVQDRDLTGAATNHLTVDVTGSSTVYANVVGTTAQGKNNTNQLTSDIVMNITGAQAQWFGMANKAHSDSSSASVNLSDGSSWTNTGSSTISSLTLDKSTVDISKGSIQTQNLKADNGTVKFDASSSNTLSAETSSGTVVLENTGNWSQGIGNGDIIKTGDGKLQASLQGATTDAGLGQFALVKTADGYKLVQVGSSNASSVIQALAASPVDVANLQLRTLGEHQTALRMSSHLGNGVWAQYMGAKQSRTTASDAHYRLHVNGVMVGADSRQTVDNGNWAVGAAFSYARGDVSALDSSADIDGYSLHLYGVRQFDNGFFVNGSAMVGRLNNDADIVANGRTVTGSYNSTGWGLDVGAGYTWRQANGLFVEPYAQLSYLTVGSADYVIDGAAAHNDRYNSLLGELGARVGSDFRAGSSTVRPYLQFALLNEFADGNKVSLSGATANASIDGAAWRTGAGVQVDFTKLVSGYAGLSYTKGDEYEAPVQGFVGLNVRW